MNREFRHKPKTITFEADENLFAEFIAFKQASKNTLSLGYAIIDSDYAYYKPLKETEVVKILGDQIQMLKERVKSLTSDCNRYYNEIKLLKENNSKTEIPKKTKRWF